MEDLIKNINLLNYSQKDSEVNVQILNMVDELARKELEPHAARFDREGTRLDDGKVITPKGYLEAIDKIAPQWLFMGVLNFIVGLYIIKNISVYTSQFKGYWNSTFGNSG